MQASPILMTGGLVSSFPQMSLRDSLRATIGWYRAQGWL